MTGWKTTREILTERTTLTRACVVAVDALKRTPEWAAMQKAQDDLVEHQVLYGDPRDDEPTGLLHL